MLKAIFSLLLVIVPFAEGSVADKIGNFDPYDTVNRFQPAASAQDVATRGFCQAPVKKALRFDVSPDWEMANTICCHNTKYAEPSGYFNTDRVRLFSRFKVEEKSHTFYDSVCGVPLFTAPVGRSLAEWQAESTAHGWPSFRPAEIVDQNVVQYANGEVRSVCGTHLGHNIPDDKGARYCIDLEPQIVDAKKDSSALTGAEKRPTRVEARTIKRMVKAIKAVRQASSSAAGPTGRQASRRLLQAATAVSVPSRDDGYKRKAGGIGDEIRRAEHRFFQEMKGEGRGQGQGATSGERFRGASKAGASLVGRAGRRELLGVGGGHWQDGDDALFGMQAHADMLRRQNAEMERERIKLIKDNERLAAILNQDPAQEAALLQGTWAQVALFSLAGVMAAVLYRRRRS